MLDSLTHINIWHPASETNTICTIREFKMSNLMSSEEKCLLTLAVESTITLEIRDTGIAVEKMQESGVFLTSLHLSEKSMKLKSQ